MKTAVRICLQPGFNAFEGPVGINCFASSGAGNQAIYTLRADSVLGKQPGSGRAPGEPAVIVRDLVTSFVCTQNGTHSGNYTVEVPQHWACYPAIRPQHCSLCNKQTATSQRSVAVQVYAEPVSALCVPLALQAPAVPSTCITCVAAAGTGRLHHHSCTVSVLSWSVRAQATAGCSSPSLLLWPLGLSEHGRVWPSPGPCSRKTQLHKFSSVQLQPCVSASVQQG